ncbi:MAG: KamA family radical SAM protein [Spirochaetales bacterium]|nr:KamA family radical SAM protein [Spirochaetales bacterium]
MNNEKWKRIFPEKISKNIRSIIKDDLEGPVALQFLCSNKEYEDNPHAVDDALGEGLYQMQEGLIHCYNNRVLLHFAADCPARCRFCFRKNSFSQRSSYYLEDNLDSYVKYLSEDNTVTDILISGGDPIILDLELLRKSLKLIRDANPCAVIRFCSRGPLTLPEKITQEFVEILKENMPLWFVFHVNHPQELNSATLEALERLREGMIPVVSQSVLLKGINDDEHILAQLFNQLLRLGIKPYYLFQADAVAGTAGFRTDLMDSLEIYGRLKILNGGLALPALAVDLPGGGGKVFLTKEIVLEKHIDYYLIKREDGVVFKYPC